ncbi:Na+/H+ antiporter subunit G [Pukyongiella litopenaei]|uniref:Na+/H+ antiporter subunit G n=1 Tax=Pukyongiella litopenaei TaxID=2605946 RepID=A0A2S0MS94_9RHOB|nr:Na+/H+ antiporter subunit G [Pukyongiella litopenaei]AVO38611.1 Na+/H+ antiporter subunit G [Pukyongiella litopenaei]
MHWLLEILIAASLLISGFFGLVGSYGLIKLGDPMSRLHAPTKATTLGVGGVLIASMLYSVAAYGYLSLHELLISLFLFLTAPVTAYFIAKMHLHLVVPEADLPPPGEDRRWAVHDLPAEDDEAAGERMDGTGATGS